MFAAKPPASAAGPTVKVETKPAKISLLGPERTKNLELILGKLKMSNALLVDSLWRINEEVLKPSTVESLCNAMPGEGERGLWAPDIDKNTLAAPDLFCMEIATVNGFDSRYEVLICRLLSMRFKSSYQDLVDDLQLKIKKTDEVIKRTVDDDTIYILMEYILGIGNYLNGQSVRGGAYGFKLEMLEKVSEVKTTDNKKNLLMYVIMKAETDKQKELVDPNENLDDLELLAKTPISQLSTDLGDLRKQSKPLEKAIKSQTNNEIDRVSEAFTDFNKMIVELLNNLDGGIKGCETSYEKLCLFFAE